MKKSFQAVRLGAFIAIAALIASTPASAAITPNISGLEPLGSAAGNEERSANLNLEAQKVEKNESGTLISITWAVDNTGEDGVSLTWLHEGSYRYSGPFFSAVNILESDGGRRFHPVMDGAGFCLCSGNTSSSFIRRINPGEKFSYWSLFSIPSDIEFIDLEAPGFEPIEDIPIS